MPTGKTIGGQLGSSNNPLPASTSQVVSLRISKSQTLAYRKSGSGPPLLLIHTIRTESAYFERLTSLLRSFFTIYALDLPGHGQSSIEQDVVYDEPYFRQALVEFMRQLDLTDVVLVGESIGAVLALTVAGELPDRVRAVVACNPYDYDLRYGDGVRRGNLLANLVIGAFSIPVVGAVFAALENPLVLGGILRGGLHDKSSLPGSLLRRFDRTGHRRGYRKVERGVFAEWRSWGRARSLYHRVGAPITLLYGEHDWSRPDERESNFARFPKARRRMLPQTGHFAALEQAETIAREVLKYAPGTTSA